MEGGTRGRRGGGVCCSQLAGPRPPGSPGAPPARGSEGGRGGYRQVGRIGKWGAGPERGAVPEIKAQGVGTGWERAFLGKTGKRALHICMYIQPRIYTRIAPPCSLARGSGRDGIGGVVLGAAWMQPLAAACWLWGAGDPSGKDPAPRRLQSPDSRADPHAPAEAGWDGGGDGRWGGHGVCGGGCAPPSTLSLLREGTEKKELNEWKLEETRGTSPLPANPRQREWGASCGGDGTARGVQSPGRGISGAGGSG